MERWQQIESLFQEALDRPATERDAFLRQACGGDADLLREVQSLVANHREGGNSHPWAASAAAQLIAAPETLEPGQSLGPYQIVSFLAAGGMGSVYRARDPRMGREVAIKVAAERFSERLSREVRAVAALNHPNICHVYDVGPNYLVMELVEGESPKGPLPLEEALRIARQIADALEEAHEKGIVHRDLKPGNIKIKPDGTVKVLDFGLAKAITTPASHAPEHSPTISMAATQAGVILGTAAYMSPEQARGKPVDKRADIWAFGVVLYELLTGQRLFQGEDLTETLAAVVKAEPGLDRAPTQVRRLLRKCLEKDPRRRVRDIGDVWELLEEEPAGQIPIESAFRWVWPGIAALLAMAFALALWAPWRHPQSAVRMVTHFTAALPEGIGRPGGIAVSRDGSRIAFSGGPRHEIYVRMIDQIEARPIPGTEGASFLSFSPDGQWISYVDSATPGQLRKVPVAGGPSVVLAEALASTGPPVENWGDDGNILFSSNGVLLRVPSGGGQPQMLATPDAKSGVFWYTAPQLLSAGRNVLVTMRKKSGMVQTVLNLQTGEKKTVLESNATAQFANTDPSSAIGHLIYYDATTGSLMAVLFDANRLQVKGSPVPVLEGVQNLAGPFGSFGFSDSGTLAYVTGVGPVSANNTLVWVDSKGVEQPLPAPANRYGAPAISPDGERLAVQIEDGSPIARKSDIWLYGLARGTLSRVTSEEGCFAPVWTSDAKLIYTFGDRTALEYGIRSISADGSGSATAVSARQRYPRYASSVSPDGKLAIGSGMRGEQPPHRGIWLLSLAAGAPTDAQAQPFLDSQFSKALPQFSPDGRWVAYQSNETGRNEIYVVPYPGPGRKEPISNGGGTMPRWARNGRELFYRNGDKMMAVDIQTTPAFRAGAPRLLFEGYAQPEGVDTTNYDVSPDGKRFLMLKPAAAENAGSGQLHVVVNWFDELRRRVPVEK